MDASGVTGDGPPIEELASVFRVYDVRTDGETLLYVGRPAVPVDVLEREVWSLFREYDYEVSLTQQYEAESSPQLGAGTYTLVAEPLSTSIDGIPWTNILLAGLTVLTTLFAGTVWYGIDLAGDPLSVFRAWPFTAAVLGVLGTHELGHYVMSRYHDVDASLPYFIPFPNPIFGTMGAVIKMRGRIPHRRALFDIGVAGPLAGLGATVVVTVVGLQLDPVTVPFELTFNNPLLLQLIAAATGQQLTYADPNTVFNPVVFGGWLGMFITFLNLLPVGQLDGGHIVRAMFGERTETLSAAVPAGMFGLGGYLYFIRDTQAVSIWIVWGVLALVLAYAGHANPVDERPLDQTRLAVGAVTFLLGLACFTPVPIEITV